MARNGGLDTDWADTWDPSGPETAVASKKGGGGGGGGGGSAAKYRKKVGAGFEKTKVVAASSMKKGLGWMKEKYNKTITNRKPR